MQAEDQTRGEGLRAQISKSLPFALESGDPPFYNKQLKDQGMEVISEEGIHIQHVNSARDLSPTRFLSAAFRAALAAFFPDNSDADPSNSFSLQIIPSTRPLLSSTPSLDLKS